MRLLSDNSDKVSAGDILLIVVARNEIDLLSAFLHHYRSIGINHFFIVDNASTDGTDARLAAEADVTLFSTTDSYRESLAGLKWTNEIGSKYCKGHWTVVVDVDEFLLVPELEGNDLKGVASRLSADGSVGMVAPLVQFFAPVGERASQRYESLTELAAACPSMLSWSDCLITKTTSFPFVDLRSAPSKFEQIVGSTVYNPPLLKIPFVHWFDGFHFSRSTHSSTPIPLAEETAPLCHFKFRPGVENRLNNGNIRSRMNPGVGKAMRAYLKLGDLNSLPLSNAPLLERIDVAQWGEGTKSFNAAWRKFSISRPECMKSTLLELSARALERATEAHNRLKPVFRHPTFLGTLWQRKQLFKLGWIHHTQLPELILEAGDPEGALERVGKIRWRNYLPFLNFNPAETYHETEHENQR